jgi:hypothetical protein
MMVKSGLDFFCFEIPLASSELLLPSEKKSAQKGWIRLAGSQVSLKGLVEFQNKKFLTTFHHPFYAKNVGFKSWDYSPLILGVLGGVVICMAIFQPEWVLVGVTLVY